MMQAAVMIPVRAAHILLMGSGCQPRAQLTFLTRHCFPSGSPLPAPANFPLSQLAGKWESLERSISQPSASDLLTCSKQLLPAPALIFCVHSGRSQLPLPLACILCPLPPPAQLQQCPRAGTTARQSCPPRSWICQPGSASAGSSDTQVASLQVPLPQKSITQGPAFVSLHV